MFNEAFWFFYWVNVVASVSAIAFITLIVCSIASVFAVVIPLIEGDAEFVKKAVRILIPIMAVSGLLGIFIPPQSAFYAGAGQYVAESAELDETLLKLKDAIDQKIDDLAEKPSD